ncbi:MAG TPA: universal stress protein [Mycobacterium sp.]|nr:universal stress protein [Mycobacterium sp.]
MPEQPGPFIPPTVVVGVDGSRAGVRAAVWAIDEATSRDIPLHLLAVTDDTAGTPPDSATSEAHTALHAAAAAVQAAGKPVRVVREVLTGSPTLCLLKSSRTAAMVCVGALGLRHFGSHRIGSTAAALVASAQCPVAVVRGGEPTDPGWVVVEVDDTPQSAAVLQFAVTEARLRGAPLRALGGWQSRYTDVHDTHAVSEGNRLVRAQLDRRLSEWRRRYPDLDVKPVAVHGSMLHYLSRNAESIQLVVVGARSAEAVGELLGPAGQAALQDTDCSVLVVDRQRLL